MIRSPQIRVLFLNVVYFILLISVFVPHHHHEEAACFTTTHCEQDLSGNDHHSEEPVDHHHDHNTPEEPQNCLSFEYYVSADSGANIKRSLDYVLSTGNDHQFFSICLDCVEEVVELEHNNLLGSFLTDKKQYISLIKHELPLRAPPSIAV